MRRLPNLPSPLIGRLYSLLVDRYQGFNLDRLGRFCTARSPKTPTRPQLPCCCRTAQISGSKQPILDSGGMQATSTEQKWAKNRPSGHNQGTRAPFAGATDPGGTANIILAAGFARALRLVLRL